MKKIKKFATGGRFVDEGESQRYVEDTPDPVAEVPVAAAIPAAIGLRGGRPMAGGLGGVMPPSGMGQDVSRPIGRMLPPILRGQGSDGGRLDQSMSAGMAGMKKGGAVKKKAKGGTVSSASKRGDGCAIKGKTKGRFV